MDVVRPPVRSRLPRLRTCWRAFSVYRSARRGRLAPLAVSWFLTGRCNLRCEGCFYYAHARETVLDLPESRLREIVDEMGDLGVAFLEFVGGEPLLRTDLVELAARAVRRGMSANLTTNGLPIRLDDGRAMDGIFDTIFVSVDGFPKENDAIRGEGVWEKAVAGLDICRAECRRAVVGVATVMNERNFASLPAWAAWVRDRGIERLALLHGFAPWGAPEPGMATAVLGELREFAARHPGFLVEDASHFDRLIERAAGSGTALCHADRLLHVAIFHDGVVSACCKYPVPLGSAAEHSLAEIFERANDPENAWQRAMAACPGCVRQDYELLVDLFGRPLPSLVVALAGRLARGRIPL